MKLLITWFSLSIVSIPQYATERSEETGRKQIKAIQETTGRSRKGVNKIRPAASPSGVILEGKC